MKKVWIIFGMLTIVVWSFAQTKPKPKEKEKEKAPTAKEMEEMMKEAQQLMDDLDPETKRMMDSMGIKVPSFKNVPKVTDKQLAEAAEMEGMVIPPKKTELIASLPKTILSKTQLADFVKKQNSSIAGIINPESKLVADKLIQQFKTDPNAGAMLASGANGMWLYGQKESAVYLMGKALELQPNADNYNNYAAYLTMTGAAHIAIPILQKLNQVHQKNSTILNNLAHAWLQLGDGVLAKKYLDSTIAIYPFHPQANFTKCLILEKEGKTTEAAAALKQSLQHSITQKKINKLKELEKNKFKHPGYTIPKVYASTSFNLAAYSALVPSEYADEPGPAVQDKWNAFREQILEEKNRVEQQSVMAGKAMDYEMKKVTSMAAKKGGVNFPPYYHQALDRLSNYSTSFGSKLKKEGEAEVAFVLEKARLKTEFEKELAAEKIRFEKIKGISKGSNSCEGELPIIKKYLKAVNTLNQKHNEALITSLTSSAYQMMNYSIDVALTDASALKAMLDIKYNFLDKLYQLPHESYTGLICPGQKKIEPYKNQPLPDYDEVNCNILNTINSPGLGTIVMRCNKMTMNLNPVLFPAKGSITANFDGYVEQASIGVTVKAVEIEVGASFDKDGNFVSGNGSATATVKGVKITASGEVDPNGFKKGSVELGLDAEMKVMPKELENMAPVQVSLKDQFGVGIEVNNDGLSGVYVKNRASGSVAASIKTDSGEKVSAASASLSANNRWGVNSGHSIGGSLSGLKF